MPVYEFVCACGHRYAELFRRTDPASSWPCPACGGQGRRVVSRFATTGRADPGPARPAWPTTWEATNRGDPETLRHWRQAIETRLRHEERDPGLGVQPGAPVLSHEHGVVVPAETGGATPGAGEHAGTDEGGGHEAHDHRGGGHHHGQDHPGGPPQSGSGT
ncbi:MAG TPA: zinc ribbon domain-containing protein [Acidimicrobiales bacterium]|nr:zinc ribbon domain-containing protein [Acidimicrobiales bacterium]